MTEEMKEAKKEAHIKLRKAQVELDEKYFEYKKEFYEIINKIEPTEDKLKFLNHDIKSFLLSKLKGEENYFLNTSPVQRLNGYNFYSDILDELVVFLKQQHEVYYDIYLTELEDKKLNGQNRELIWNGPNNVLIDAFQKMKRKLTKDGIPFLGNTSEEIAQHLKSSYNCFEESTVSSIQNQLDRTNPPKKTENLIDPIE